LQVYCGPVPQIDNGFAVAATNVSFGGTASYQCYAGFAFPSGLPIETISCNSDGTWTNLPVCQGNPFLNIFVSKSFISPFQRTNNAY
jgi:hypothetical protein